MSSFECLIQRNASALIAVAILNKISQQHPHDPDIMLDDQHAFESRTLPAVKSSLSHFHDVSREAAGLLNL
jgi:hypothetical protein